MKSQRKRAPKFKPQVVRCWKAGGKPAATAVGGTRGGGGMRFAGHVPKFRGGGRQQAKLHCHSSGRLCLSLRRTGSHSAAGPRFGMIVDRIWNRSKRVLAAPEGLRIVFRRQLFNRIRR